MLKLSYRWDKSRHQCLKGSTMYMAIQCISSFCDSISDLHVVAFYTIEAL